VDIGSAGVRISDDGDGAVTFLGLGNGNDEDITINLDDGTANTATVTSSTGLNALNFSGITLQQDGSDVTTNTGGQTLTNKTFTAPKYADLGFIADANGNELIIFDTVTSAVNEVTFANAATGTNPAFTASGGDKNIGLNFQVKGTGVYRLLATASGPTDLRLFEDSDNGTNYASIIAPASMAADRVLTLPDATDTLAGIAATQVFTNKSLTSPTITTPTMNGAAAWEDGTRQTFNPNGTNAGVNVGSQAGDPSGPSNGDLWYDSTNNTLDARINGATVSLGAGGGAPTDATYITQTANGSLSAEQALSSLSTGIMRVATTTGVITSLTDSSGIAANISDETGTGALVLASAPALVGPIVGNGATGPGYVDFREDTDNGSNRVRLIGPASTADVDVTLPAVAGTIITSADTVNALASSTSANLRTLLSDETGTGTAMFTRTGVRRTLYINAGAMIPRTTNGAATGTTQSTTNNIMMDTFDFDSTTEEGVGFWWTPPSTWDAGTITFKAHWTASAGTGTAKWDFAARGYADDDAIDQALGTEQGSTDTLLATGDMHISPTTSALTVGGTPAANRPVYIQVARDVATDTLNADAKLIGVTIEYTESATEPSAQ
jgi:hypothetical protein